jgi:AcrR family transcriptional regulator
MAPPIKAGKKSKPALQEDPLEQTAEAPAALPRLSLLAAGEAVIAEKGFARATVEDIAMRAGVSADVFYGHFSGKGAMLRALCDRWVTQMTTVTNDATRSGIWATASPSEIIDVAARSAIDAIYDHAPLIRAVLAHGATDPTLSAALKKIGTLLTRRSTKVIKEIKSKTEKHIGEREVAFCLLLAIGLAHHAVLVGADSTGHPFSRDDVASEASRAIAAYLGVPASKPQERLTAADPVTHQKSDAKGEKSEKVPSRRNIRAAARV